MKEVTYKDIKNWEVIVSIEEREKKKHAFMEHLQYTPCSLIIASFELDINPTSCHRLENKN